VNPRERLLATILPVIWGFNFVVLSWGLKPVDGKSVPPLLFAAIRFLLASLPLLVFVPRPKVPFVKVAVVGLFTLAGQYGLLYSSMSAGMPAGLASLVLQVQVPLTIVIALIVLREQPTSAQISGVLLAGAGLIVVGVGRGGHVPLGALMLCLAAGLSWAIGNVLTRALKVPGGLGLIVWSSLVVPIPLLLLSLIVDGPNGVADGFAAFGWQAALSSLYTVVLSTLAAFAIFNTLMARHPASSVVPWILLVPPVGIVSAWLILDEVPTLFELLGGAVVILGVLVAQRSRQPAPRSSEAIVAISASEA
jgi:O-acetylserine/cysteine efflux transporter